MWKFLVAKNLKRGEESTGPTCPVNPETMVKWNDSEFSMNSMVLAHQRTQSCCWGRRCCWQHMQALGKLERTDFPSPPGSSIVCHPGDWQAKGRQLLGQLNSVPLTLVCLLAHPGQQRSQHRLPHLFRPSLLIYLCNYSAPAFLTLV